ncbi:hypothetical protein EON65_34400 [archaeon]|nr:MAG: hypothetical protein EON65_34400 [archaeon]
MVFYHNYQRSKLTEDDLFKICKKYQKKPADLLRDLQKKYENIHIVPSRVTYYELSRVLHSFPIPVMYKDAIFRDIEKNKLPAYSAQLDACSTKLDVSLIFPTNSSDSEPQKLFASDPNMPPKDNMSSVLRLMPSSYVLSGEVS